MWFVGIVKLFELLLVAVVVAVVATFKKKQDLKLETAAGQTR